MGKYFALAVLSLGTLLTTPSYAGGKEITLCGISLGVFPFWTYGLCMGTIGALAGGCAGFGPGGCIAGASAVAAGCGISLELALTAARNCTRI